MFYAVNFTPGRAAGSSVYWYSDDASNMTQKNGSNLLRADDKYFDPIYFDDIEEANAAVESILNVFSYSVEKYGAYPIIICASTLKALKEIVMNYPLHIMTS
jgi:hypothetical protein